MSNVEQTNQTFLKMCQESTEAILSQSERRTKTWKGTGTSPRVCVNLMKGGGSKTNFPERDFCKGSYLRGVPRRISRSSAKQAALVLEEKERQRQRQRQRGERGLKTSAQAQWYCGKEG